MEHEPFQALLGKDGLIRFLFQTRARTAPLGQTMRTTVGAGFDIS